MSQDVRVPTVASHASLYELVPVEAQTRPIILNVYAEMPPMSAIKATAGMSAEGALPKAAIPRVLCKSECELEDCCYTADAMMTISVRYLPED